MELHGYIHRAISSSVLFLKGKMCGRGGGGGERLNRKGEAR